MVKCGVLYVQECLGMVKGGVCIQEWGSVVVAWWSLVACGVCVCVCAGVVKCGM